MYNPTGIFAQFHMLLAHYQLYVLGKILNTAAPRCVDTLKGLESIHDRSCTLIAEFGSCR